MRHPRDMEAAEVQQFLSMLTTAEVAALFKTMIGVELLLAKLLYGTGKRLNEGQRWGWFWLFPVPKLSVDPRSRIERRQPR